MNNNNYADLRFDLSSILVINQTCCVVEDVLATNVSKIPTDIALASDASSKQHQMKEKDKDFEMFKVQF